MKFLSIAPLGQKNGIPRLWIESKRLESLGFPPGTPLEFRRHDNELSITPAVLANNHVSSRRIAGGRRPIIDVADAGVLKPITDFSELKIRAWHRRIQIHASERAAAILRARSLSPPFRVMEAFAGGGTMSAALSTNANYRMVAGIEIEPSYADVWQAAHPDSLLIQADIRAVSSRDLPDFDVLIGGIPCTIPLIKKIPPALTKSGSHDKIG